MSFITIIIIFFVIVAIVSLLSILHIHNIIDKYNTDKKISSYITLIKLTPKQQKNEIILNTLVYVLFTITSIFMIIKLSSISIKHAIVASHT
jgi:hypothetical protein